MLNESKKWIIIYVKLNIIYCKKNEYVDTIEFRDVLYLLRDFLDKLQLDIVFV